MFVTNINPASVSLSIWKPSHPLRQKLEATHHHHHHQCDTPRAQCIQGSNAMAGQPQRTVARGHLSDAETAALIDSWAPLYRRRRDGEGDMWVLPARRSRALVLEDWRAVATSVNAYRAGAGLDSVRTHQQCKRCVAMLRKV